MKFKYIYYLIVTSNIDFNQKLNEIMRNGIGEKIHHKHSLVIGGKQHFPLKDQIQ